MSNEAFKGPVSRLAEGRELWVLGVPSGWKLEPGLRVAASAPEFSGAQPVGWIESMLLPGTSEPNLTFTPISVRANPAGPELTAALEQDLPFRATVHVDPDGNVLGGTIRAQEPESEPATITAKPGTTVTITVRTDAADAWWQRRRAATTPTTTNLKPTLEVVTGAIQPSARESKSTRNFGVLVPAADASSWDLDRYAANPVVMCRGEPVGTASVAIEPKLGGAFVDVTLGTKTADEDQAAAKVAEGLLRSIAMIFDGRELVSIALIPAPQILEVHSDEAERLLFGARGYKPREALHLDRGGELLLPDHPSDPPQPQRSHMSEPTLPTISLDADSDAVVQAQANHLKRMREGGTKPIGAHLDAKGGPEFSKDGPSHVSLSASAGELELRRQERAAELSVKLDDGADVNLDALELDEDDSALNAQLDHLKRMRSLGSQPIGFTKRAALGIGD